MKQSIIILLLLACSCKSVQKDRNYRKEAKVKQGYLNGIQFGNKDLQKKYAKKFRKIKPK